LTLIWPKILAAPAVFVLFFGLGFGSKWLVRPRSKKATSDGIVMVFIGELLYWTSIVMGI
jgi:hypothetical protein